jgi:hypothetical protein
MDYSVYSPKIENMIIHLWIKSCILIGKQIPAFDSITGVSCLLGKNFGRRTL